MAGIGFSPADIVQTIVFARKIYTSSKRAGEDFRSITADVKSLESYFRALETEINDSNSLVHRSSSAKRSELQTLLGDCWADLESLKKLLSKYKSLKTTNPRARDKLSFTASKQADIRISITTHSDRLSRFLNSLHTGALGRIEGNTETHALLYEDIRNKLDSLRKDVLAGRRDPSVFTGVGSWLALEQELLDDNITEVDVEINKEGILRWLQQTRSGDSTTAQLDQYESEYDLSGDDGSAIIPAGGKPDGTVEYPYPRHDSSEDSYDEDHQTNEVSTSSLQHDTKYVRLLRSYGEVPPSRLSCELQEYEASLNASNITDANGTMRKEVKEHHKETIEEDSEHLSENAKMGRRNSFPSPTHSDKTDLEQSEPQYTEIKTFSHIDATGEFIGTRPEANASRILCEKEIEEQIIPTDTRPFLTDLCAPSESIALSLVPSRDVGLTLDVTNSKETFHSRASYFSGNRTWYAALPELPAEIVAIPSAGQIIEARLKITLKEIFTGTTKKVAIRKTMGGGTDTHLVHTFDLHIEQGAPEGREITVRQFNGELVSASPFQGLQFVFEITPNVQQYRFLGHDIHQTLKFTFSEAQEGFERNVTSIDGAEFCLFCEGPTKPSLVARIPGFGMPIPDTEKRGDFVIDLSIDYGRIFSYEQKNLFNEALKLSVTELSIEPAEAEDDEDDD